MSERSERLRRAFVELEGGSVAGFKRLFAEDAQWLGVPAIGVDGRTPI